MKTVLIIMFALGVAFCSVAVIKHIDVRANAPLVSFTGKAELDTASHEDLRLNNSITIANSGAPNARVYLRFTDDKTMNDVIGENVRVTGRLRSTMLDNGDFITELTVQSVQHVK